MLLLVRDRKRKVFHRRTTSTFKLNQSTSLCICSFLYTMPKQGLNQIHTNTVTLRYC